MRRPSRSLLLAALLVIGTVGIVATPTAGAQPQVAIRDVTVDVENPAPGETFTVSVLVAALQSSSGPIDVTEVTIERAGSDRDLASISDAGTIAPGSTISVPLAVRLNDLGGVRLTVSAVVEDRLGRETTVRYPLYVVVERPDDAALAFAGFSPIAGQEDQLSVRVVNGATDTLSNLRLTLTGNGTVDSPERVTAALAPGAERTYTYNVTVAEAGRASMTATLTYRTSAGYTRTIERQLSMSVDRPVVDTDLTATVTSPNGSTAIRVAVTEYGNVDLREGQVSVRVEDRTAVRTLLPTVPPKATRVVEIDGADVPPGTVSIVATYTVAGTERTIDRRLQFDPEPTASLAIAGVQLTRVGDRLTLHGNASNLGSTRAGAVLLTVLDADGVAPVAPNRESFVGAIAPSQRGAFELTATVDPAVSAVPVRLSYTVDGERLSEVREIHVGDAPAPSASITLTGLEYAERDGVLTMRGDAANVGDVDARSVLVGVGETGGVVPVSPKREYFVGSVDASEFATFELTANVSATVGEVPIRLAYTVDGQRLHEVVSVSLPPPAARAVDTADGGGLGLLPIVLGLMAIAIVVLVVYRRRRR